jgi:hypothetical protein
LAFKFFGPYRILARVGSVAYKLDLPELSSVHPVVHVSQLKKSVGEHPISSSLPADSIEFQIPEAILQRRLTDGDKPVEQALIKWSGMPSSLATWENLEALKCRFPHAPAWGHAGSQEEGDVSTSTTQKPNPEDRPKSKRSSRPNVRLTGPECM